MQLLFFVICLITVATARPGQLSQYIDFNSISPPSQSLYEAPPISPSSVSSPILEKLEDNHIDETPLISKHIYYHTAPEEPEDEPRTILTSKPQKNYRVVFIRAPVQNRPRLSLKNPNSANEDKTIIYVLSKKIDSSDLDISTPAPITEPSKPEVYFIQYKTQEEAWNAQQHIQAQYDAIGGETKHNDEETSPIQSVVGTYNNNDSTSPLSEQISDISSLLSTNNLSSSSQISTFNNLLRNRDYIPPKVSSSSDSAYLPPQRKF